MAARFEQYLNPVISALHQLGGSARPEEVYDCIAKDLGLNESQLGILNESGVSRFENDVAWARFYLARSGYLDSSKHGVWSLTERGRAIQTLSEQQVGELLRLVRRRRPQPITSHQPQPNAPTEEPDSEAEAPIDVNSLVVANNTYREHVLEIMRQLPPDGFERLCQRILRESGFQQVRVTGRSGDGGIDGVGILQVNPFVSFKVLFQSKRYSGSVSPAQVRDFRGAMMGRADKGLIITTGSFSADAKAEAVRDGVPPIELVDGPGLVSLLEQLEIGLKPIRTFEIDTDFFDDFQ